MSQYFVRRNPIPTSRVFAECELALLAFSVQPRSRLMNVNAMGTQSSNALSEPSASDKNGVPAGRIADLIARLKREQKRGTAPSAANVEAALQLANGKADVIFAVPSGSRSRIYKLRDKVIALGLHDDVDGSSKKKK